MRWNERIELAARATKNDTTRNWKFPDAGKIVGKHDDGRS